MPKKYSNKNNKNNKNNKTKKQLGGSSSSTIPRLENNLLTMLKKHADSTKDPKAIKQTIKAYPKLSRISSILNTRLQHVKDTKTGDFKRKLMKIGKLVIPYCSPEWDEIVNSEAFRTKINKKFITISKNIYKKENEKIIIEHTRREEDPDYYGAFVEIIEEEDRRNREIAQREMEKYTVMIKAKEEEIEQLKKELKEAEKNQLQEDKKMKDYLKKIRIDLVFQPFRLIHKETYNSNNLKQVSYLNNINRIGKKNYSLIKPSNLKSELDKTEILVYQFFKNTKDKILKNIELFLPTDRLDTKIMRKIKSNKKFQEAQFLKEYKEARASSNNSSIEVD
jgi:hypothetical protein